MELAPVQPSSTQPDAQTVVDQDLHSITPFVGKQISAVQPGGTKDLNDSGQGFAGMRPGITPCRL